MENMLSSIVVVYAEDEYDIRNQVATFLRRRVKEVFEAENGKEGLELIKKHDPDIVITDLEMPVMNGLDFIKKIREFYNGGKPIIVLTGYSDDDHHTDLADYYIYKPIDLFNLLEVIKNLLLKNKSDPKA